MMPEMDDDKGTGLVLVNTEKGRQSLDWSKVTYKESNIEKASKYNAGLSPLTNPHPKRTEFFARLDKCESVTELINKSLRPPFAKRVRITLGRYKQLVKHLIKNLTGGGEAGNMALYRPDTIPSISSNATVTTITFRNKQKGWKSYSIEINLN